MRTTINIMPFNVRYTFMQTIIAISTNTNTHRRESRSPFARENIVHCAHCACIVYKHRIKLRVIQCSVLNVGVYWSKCCRLNGKEENFSIFNVSARVAVYCVFNRLHGKMFDQSSKESLDSSADEPLSKIKCKRPEVSFNCNSKCRNKNKIMMNILLPDISILLELLRFNKKTKKVFDANMWTIVSCTMFIKRR